MFAVPAETPDTIPVGPTEATDTLLLLHEPPPTSDSVVVEPVQTFPAPVIDDGSAFTVIVNVEVHPEGKV